MSERTLKKVPCNLRLLIRENTLKLDSSGDERERM